MPSLTRKQGITSILDLSKLPQIQMFTVSEHKTSEAFEAEIAEEKLSGPVQHQQQREGLEENLLSHSQSQA